MTSESANHQVNLEACLQSLSERDRTKLLDWIHAHSSSSAAMTLVPLTNGRCNNNYQLRLNNRDYFLQIRSKTHQPLLSYRMQSRIFSLASLQPWLATIEVYGEDFVLQSFIFRKAQAHAFSAEHQSLLTDFLIHLHQQTCALPSLSMTPYLTSLYQRAVSAQPHQKLLEATFTEALAQSEAFRPVCLCHNDLNPHNLLWQTASSPLKVIDWEYAAISDPCYEWAVLISEHQLKEAIWQPMLERYQQQSGIRIEANKLSRMCRLYEALKILWKAASGA